MNRTNLIAFIVLRMYGIPKPICCEIILLAHPRMSLYSALAAGNDYIVKKILKTGVISNLCLTSYSGCTGNSNYIDVFADNAPTAFYAACRYGKLEFAKLALQCDALTLDRCIEKAIKFGWQKIVLALFCNKVHVHLYKYLRMALPRGQKKLIEYFSAQGHYDELLRHFPTGVDLEERICKFPIFGNPAKLMYSEWAGFNNSIKATKHIMNVDSKLGEVILNAAIEKSSLDVIETLVENGYDIQPEDVLWAVEIGNFEVIDYLLDVIKKPILSAVDDDECYLRLARMLSLTGHFNLARFLLSQTEKKEDIF